ncbi:MAG TPA: DUF6580 family putative transport protein [Candidatus Margulisiibacteriota bacterium]|nr:DUF6580 family putative transport protein [Candidatus Margulisiibacteriota bacterium]
MLVLFLILTGILLRFIPHAPNFTPVAAIAIFGGAYLNKKYALIIPLVIMALSDYFLGMHNVVLFTWTGFIASSFIGFWLKRHKNTFGITTASLSSSVVFYLISNFGVWLMGWYPPTLQGLLTSYVMGLPFLRDFAMATVIYTGIMVSITELVTFKVKNTKLAKVLLTI